MANVYMSTNTQTNSVSGSVVYEYSAIYTTAGVKDTVLLPDESGKKEKFSAGLIVTSGTGSIEYTLSNRSDVIAGNGNWRLWTNGVVSANSDDLLGPVTAIRANIATSGSVVFEVIAV